MISNAVLAAIGRLLTVASTLVITPVVLATLGMTRYGTWEVIAGLVGYLTLLDVGVGQALLKYVTDAYTREDVKGVTRYVGLGLTLNLGLACIVCPIFWFGRHGIVRLLNVPPEIASEAAIALPLSTVSMFIAGANAAVGTIVSGSQRAGVTALIVALGALVSAGVAIAGVTLGFSLPSLAVGQIAGSVVTGGIFHVVARRVCQGVRIAPGIPSYSDAKRLWSYGSRLLIARLAEILGGQTDRLVLGIMATPQWVGYYAIAARLASLVREVMGFVYTPIVTASAALNAKNDLVAVGQLYAKTMAVLSVATGALAVVVIGVHNRLEVLWLNHYIPATTPIVLGLTVAYTLHMATAPGTAICRGVNKVGIEAKFSAVCLVANLLLTPGLVLLVGPWGTVVATMASLIIGSLFFFVTLHRNLELPVLATYRSLRGVAAACLASAIILGVSFWVEPPVSRQMAFWTSIVLGVGAICAFSVFLVAFRAVDLKCAFQEVALMVRRKRWLFQRDV